MTNDTDGSPTGVPMHFQLTEVMREAEGASFPASIDQFAAAILARFDVRRKA